MKNLIMILISSTLVSACNGPADKNIRLGDLTGNNYTTGVFPEGITIPAGEHSILIIQNKQVVGVAEVQKAEPYCLFSIFSNTVYHSFTPKTVKVPHLLPTKYGYDGITTIKLAVGKSNFEVDLNRDPFNFPLTTSGILLCTRGNKLPDFSETSNMTIGEIGDIFGFVYHKPCGGACM